MKNNQEIPSFSSNTSRLTKKFLKESKLENLETLDILIENLESTVDPDPSELYLLDSLYQLKEKIVLTETRIKNYLKKTKDIISDNKLDDLYNTETPHGTSKLFKN